MNEDETAKLLQPTTSDIEGEDGPVSRPIALRVDLTKNRRAIRLRLTHLVSARDGPHEVEETEIYALSPPAARRLSRLLRQAVRDYLEPPDHKQDNDQE